MGLRELPPEIVPGLVSREASALGWIGFGARMTGLSRKSQRRIQQARNDQFDRRMSNSLRPTDDVALLGDWSAPRSLRRCADLGVRSIFNFPIAHHRYARALLEEEARLQPEFACTLQFPSRDPQRDALLDDEFQRADYLLGFSPFHIDTFVEMGVDRSKFLEAPLGVDIDLFSEMACRGPDQDTDRPFRVLFVGQLTQRKGLSYLIEGFKKAAIANSELMLVGAVVGSDAPWRNTPRLVHLPGQLRSRLPSIYSSADVFVMPSLIEGFCLTVLEAMASGVPAVVTPHTCGDSVVRDGVEGWTIPIRDSDAIAERLLRLHANRDEAQAMGRNARRRAEQFSWRHFEQRLVSEICTRTD